MKTNPMNRRSFFKVGLLGLCSLPFLKKALISDALAAKDKKCADPAAKIKSKIVEKDSAKAKSFKYVEVAANAKGTAKYKQGDDCKSCFWYQKARVEGDWAPCTMFGMKYVPACGWCNQYKKRPGA